MTVNKGRRLYTKIMIGMMIGISIIILILLLLFPIKDMPKPTGEYMVGTQYMSFVDTDRREVFSTEEEYRNIPLQVWYPAMEDSEEECAAWINNSKAMYYFTEYRNLPNLLGYFSKIKTNSHLNAILSDREEKYPVIVFSGGGAMFYGQNVIQMEELASHGYIVFAVGHPYEDFADIYPDGRLVPYNPEQKEKLSMDTGQAVEAAKLSGLDENSPEFTKFILRNAKCNNESVRIWADDLSFMISKIEEMNEGLVDSIFRNRLDEDSIGAFGHSFGGAASGQACLEDNRIQAFVNMDGGVFGDAVDRCINQPFMVLTTGGKVKSRIADGYSDQQKNYIVVAVDGAMHMNYSDLNSLIPILGKLTGFLGSIPEERQNRITNAYLMAFFDRELRGDETSDLLQSGPSQVYDEVRVDVF